MWFPQARLATRLSIIFHLFRSYGVRMDYWTRTGRPAIVAALEAVCNAVEEDLAAAIQEREESRHALLLEENKRLKASAARVDQLEKENRSLLQELEQLRSKHFPRDPKTARSSVLIPAQSGEHASPSARPPLAEISANRQARPSNTTSATRDPEDKDLHKEYSKLARKYANLKKAYEKTETVARTCRDSRDKWIEYAESLEAKVKRLEIKLQRDQYHQLPYPSGAASNAAKLEPVTAVSSHIRGAFPSRLMSDAESHNGLRRQNDAITRSPGRKRAASTPAVAMAQHTRRHEDPPVEAETQDETDSTDDLPPVPPDRDASSEVEIKQEPSSDSPVIISERTVRKRKHTNDERGTLAPSRRIKTEQSTSSDPVITGEGVTFSPHESIDLDEEQDGIPTPRKKRPRGYRPLRGEEAILKADEPPDTPTLVPDWHTGRPAAPTLSADKAVRTYGGQRRRIRADWNLDAGIADVAEEDFESFHYPEPRQDNEAPTHPPPAQGRLKSLLNSGSPEPNVALLRPTRHNGDSLQSSKASPIPRRPQDKADPPRLGRLRERPLADLKLEDFKVNPEFNDGYTHAFDEVVRNKGERAELAGCTDPNCCGKKFRAMAESELNAGGPGILSRVADTKMLEDYLGSEAYRLVEMTQEERKELWLKAKTQDLANRYGRHRHRFARRPSPPGYWNPDFPSTQEIQMRKAEGEKMERRLVEERWREAMRGGGRWLFRDE
ncbi:hypothetical protein VTK56DRAFT_4456 [Thermocarpiscus australiensis]